MKSTIKSATKTLKSTHEELKNVKSCFARDTYSPNVSLVRSEGCRLIKGAIPRVVRTELMAGVKKGVLGRLKKEGLKPEVFYHPDHESVAISSQTEAAIASAELISKILC